MVVNEMQSDFPTVVIKVNEPLSRYTYTKTGGPADILVFPKTEKEVIELVAWIKERELPLIVLGNASNLIVKDGGIRGVVMVLTDMKQIEVKKDHLIVQSGAKLIDTSYQALRADLTGLEFACGIPGSVGGAVFMNAGAYEGEISEVLESALVISETGDVQRLSNEELNFSYRYSAIQERGGIILEAVFQLKKGNPEAIQTRMQELTVLRESKQPLEYPSCGSVFKRPTGYFTGKLIQEAGLQGKVWGGAQISEKHAGFIVNINEATATDYIELIAYIQEVILKDAGVALETEVRTNRS